MHDEGMRRVQVIISGQVQGVGFRYHTRQVAERLALTGWVRNRIDGAVEAEAEGEEESVEELLTWLADGPASAHVQSTHVTEMDPTGGSTFDLLF